MCLQLTREAAELQPWEQSGRLGILREAKNSNHCSGHVALFSPVPGSS